MTRSHNGHQEATPFSHWLRQLPTPLDSRNVSNQNLDYVWHDYRRNYLLTIEEKRFGGTATSAQQDTHGVIAQMLANSNGLHVHTARGVRPVTYFGHYLVRFQNTTPEDGNMWINGIESTKTDLLEILAFRHWTQTNVLRDAA